jgi:hypothetical protein
MSQYVEYTTGVTITYTDGVDIFRDGSRDGTWVTDHTLTPTGFAGAENTDWENIEMQDTDGGIGIDTFRDGIRSECYVIDKTLTISGFLGDESLDEGLTGDWINIQTLTL